MKMPILRLTALVITLVAGTAALSPAQAQTKEQVAARAREAAQADNIKTLNKVFEPAGFPCEIVEVAGPTTGEATADGKKVAIEAYEVACKDQRGFIVYKTKTALFGNPMGCLEAAAVAKAVPGSQTCKLKANRAAHYWLGDTAKSKIPNCTLASARFIRADAKASTELYEIGCKNTAGGIFVVPTFKATDKTVTYYNCLKTAETALKCELTTPEQAPQTLAAIVKTNAPDCALSNARFGGATKDAEYYEVGCKDKPGFVLVTDIAGEFKGAVGCDKAQAIGGCKFTDSAALVAAGKAKADEAKAKYKNAYAAALTAGGVTCTIEDFRRIGRDTGTNRDLAEFKCAETPNGLIALIPDAGSAGKLDTFDCFAAAVQKTDCAYVTKDQLKANLQKLATGHKSIKADCVIGEARYAFENAGQVVMEIACVNKRGYIAVLNKARTALNPAVPCHIAATNPGVPEKCTIAGNGSNKEG